MPPVKFDETYEPRPWRCEECQVNILGVVMRDANRIRRVWVFWKDRTDATAPSTYTLRNAPRGLFRVHGADNIPRSGGVECSHCGALNDWYQSKESYEWMISHYLKESSSESV